MEFEEITPEEMNELVESVFKPTPFSGITRETLDDLGEQAEKNLHVLSKTVLDGRKPPSGAYAFFNNNAHTLSRVQDVRKIMKRLYNGRIRLTELAKEEHALMPKDWPAGVPYPKEVQDVMRQEGEVNSYMQLDLESLYIFGGILLDQWSLQAIAIADLSLRKRHPFVELVDFFEANSGTLLQPVWEQLGKEMLWLHYQLRFYRNRFIVHANRPWQRGTTRSVYGGDYNLHTPTPPGWEDDDKLDTEIKSLIHLAPERLQKAPDDYWEKARAGALIERLFDNIPNLPKKADREKIAELFGKKGGSTPSFQTILKHVLDFVSQGTFLLTEIASKNLSAINLGPPFATSEEMWKKDRKS